MVDVSRRADEREFVLPARPPQLFVPSVDARVVGPGRRERAYLARVAELEATLAAKARELDASTRLERGCQRLLDRLEHHVDLDREQLVQLQQQQKQLILALGAAQREVEMLREQLLLAAQAPRQLRAGRAGWLARLLGRR
jgi:hypothetical protein